ncbi:MAG TPA: PadR family transcriptional regulator [Gemmatimonadaceae bacterium]|nr:PadR family transcriptional regulator [Gemmatimonadaceae bacterium]
MGTDNSIPYGTLDLLILKLLSLEPTHGWGISEWIQKTSADSLRVGQGSLYASLHRMTREGFIKSYWQDTDAGRRARYYAITATGKKQLARETEHWTRLTRGVGLVLAANAV